MGILNTTPDSFSDGGQYLDPAQALEHALQMVEDGADIIDVGGESTRPGAHAVEVAEELERVIPVIARLSKRSDVAISIDTSKAEVASQAIEAGAHIINDIGGMRLDPRIGSVAAETGAGLVLMHMQGTPRTMQAEPKYEDLLAEIADFLESATAAAILKGVKKEALVVDPGIGFGKRLAHNWNILMRIDQLRSLGYPILIGASRKRFLRELVGESRSGLEAATVATSVTVGLAGARIVRVHDVRSHVSAMKVVGELLRSSPGVD